MTPDWISDSEWETVVRNVPIVSVDLVVETANGIVLGKRRNDPAKGEWFVPGGRVLKGEPLVDAVSRVARGELGVPVSIAERLGTYEHFYENADVAGTGKHYVAVAFHVYTDVDELSGDTQHRELRIFESPPENLHPYVEAYLRDAGV